MDLQSYVQEFQEEEYQCLCEDVEYIKKLPSLPAAIEYAAMGRTPSGKRHSHQYKISRANLTAGKEILLANQEAIRNAQDFEALIETVGDLVGPIPGLGELYIYDTAFRIGVYLDKWPEKVYLHAGVRVGASALGLDSSRPTVEMSELPDELQRLPPYKVEDFLCLFKDDLMGRPRRSHRCCPRPRTGKHPVRTRLC